MGALRVDFRRCLAQSRAWRRLKPKNRVCNAWGRGVGKSWFARVAMYLLVSEWERRERKTLDGAMTGIRIVLLMPTLKQFKKVHEQAIEGDLGRNGPWSFLGAVIDHTDWRITFPGGSWIQVVSAANVDDNRGIRGDVVVADECDDIEIAAYEGVCIPWFSEPWSLDIRLLSGTPRRGRYGLLWRGFRVWPDGDANHAPVPNHYSFHATYRDAPDIVSAALVEEARRTMSPDRFAREWESNFDSGEGLVYPHFREDFHVRYPHPETQWREFIVGVDWGFEDPFVALAYGIAGHGRDVQIHQLGEWVVQHATDSELVELARRIDQQFPNARWFADPSKPGSIEAFRRSVDLGPDGYNRGGAGVRIEAADNSIEDGVATVADVLVVRDRPEPLGEWSQLFIHPDCRYTIQEFGLYRRRRDSRNPELILDTIEDKNNHAMDAKRYAIHSRFGGTDRRIRTGYEAR